MKTTTIHTIQKLFAKRVLMLIATVMMASSAWGMSTSDIEHSAATTITDGAAYVIATAYNGYYLTSEAYSDWGQVSNDINNSAIFVAHGNASSFYLMGPRGTLVVGANSKFPAYNDGTTANLTLGASGEILSSANNAFNLRSNTDSKFRWYSGTTGSSVYLFKITTKFTITYNAGSGSCKANDPEASAGSGVTLASASPSAACAAGGWVFAGWKQTSAQTETTSIPTLIPGGSVYHPHSNETLYAVYRLGAVYSIDFESTAATYSDWTFTSLNPQGTNAAVCAHDGTKFGLTANANGSYSSIETKTAISSPQSIRFYISKTTSNTTSSDWVIYTSSDNGNTWNSRETISSISMVQGVWVEVIKDLSSYSNVKIKVEFGTTNSPRCIDELVLSCATYNSSPSCCANAVALSKGTESNGTITLGATGIATCSATAADRQVTISVTPAQGYDAPETLVWTQTEGTTFAAPTKVSGPTKNGTTYDYVYQFPQNVSGAGTFGASSRAFTNFRTHCCTDSKLTFGTIASPVTEYVIVRQDLAKSTDSVSIDCNFESLNTSEITWYKTSWVANTFPARSASSRTTPAGQQYIRLNVANKTLKSNSTGVYTVIIQQEEAEVSGTTYCGQQASVTVTVKTVDKFVDAVNGNFSGEPQGLEDTGGGILLPTEETFSTNNGCSDGIARRLLGWIKESDLNVGNSSYKVSGRVNYIDDLKTGDASNKVIAPGTRVAATGITWYAVWGVEQE